MYKTNRKEYDTLAKAYVQKVSLIQNLGSVNRSLTSVFPHDALVRFEEIECLALRREEGSDSLYNVFHVNFYY